MFRASIPAALVLLPVTALAAPMEEACAARGGWSAETCTCMQAVADDTLDAEDQALAVEVVEKRTTIREIAQTQGMAAAQSFAENFAAFGTRSKAECGAP